MEEAEPKDNLGERQYYLSQFHQIADQRLKVFGFYFLITAASAGWMVSLVGKEDFLAIILYVFAAGQMLIGVFFYLLDKRNQEIMGRIRIALINLEQSLPPPLQTFTADKREHYMDSSKRSTSKLGNFGSELVRFSNLFRAVFIFQIVVALLLILVFAVNTN